MAKALALVLLGFSLGILVSGFSADVEFEYGQCRFGKAQNGTFYDQAMSPRLYLTPRCAEIGLAQKFSGSNWGWRVSFVTSGAVESRDSLAQMNDGFYDPHPCTNDTWANCHSFFGGSGRMHGFSLSITKEWTLTGRWWAQAEAGVLFFKHYFNGYAKPQDFRNDTALAAGAVTGTSEKWEGGSLSQSSKFPGMPVPRFGGRLGYGPLYFSLRYNAAPGALGLPGHDGSSVTDHSFTEVTAGLRISL